MLDLYHQFGEDFVLSPTGNYETATGATLTSQTVIRFLLTNPGDDLFAPTFGLGANQMIGEVEAAQKTKALILKGLRSLDVIDQTQPISVTVYFDGEGTLTAALSYSDAVTGFKISQVLPVA